MIFKKCIIHILLLINVFGCSKNIINNANTKILYVTSDNGLILREKPTQNSSKIALIPYKSSVKQLDNNGPVDVIYNKNNKWIKVKYNELTGWVFGEFLTKEKINSSNHIDEESLKYSIWESEPNEVSYINLKFDSFNIFELRVTGYIINKNTPNEIMTGEWKIINNDIVLKFHCKNKFDCDYRDLLLNEKGKKYYNDDGIKINAKNEFSFNKNVQRIYFWGVVCKRPHSIF